MDGVLRDEQLSSVLLSYPVKESVFSIIKDERHDEKKVLEKTKMFLTFLETSSE
jgi:hypothetical protein